MLYLRSMFGGAENPSEVSVMMFMGMREVLTLGVGVVLCAPVALAFVYVAHPVQAKLRWTEARYWLSDAFLASLLLLSLVTVAGSTFDPFIYFRF